jgi:hypothetical protein
MTPHSQVDIGRLSHTVSDYNGHPLFSLTAWLRVAGSRRETFPGPSLDFNQLSFCIKPALRVISSRSNSFLQM